MTQLRTSVLLIFALALVSLYAQGSQPARYEFRGKVLQSDGKPFPDVAPVAFLYGSMTPFTAQTLADGSGRFTFKGLRAGIYTLTISVPQVGQLRQTIDVGPSFADKRGRIEVTFRFDPQATADDSQVVSAVQLSVPEKAKREYQRAQGRLNKHDISGAVSYLKKAVQLAPHFSEAWNNLGTIAYQTQDYKQAEQYFREALKQEPNSYAPLVNLGGALLSQGRAQDSLPINIRAVKMKPEDALAHSQLGQSYYFLGQLDNAEIYLKQAKALDPRHFSFPQLVLAEVYRQKQDYAAMLAELEEFLRHHPDSQVTSSAKRSLEWARRRMKEVTSSPEPVR